MNTRTIVITTATIILAGIAMFTAWKLYELRNQAVSPTAPNLVPAQEIAPSCRASFTVQAVPSTPTPTPTPTPAGGSPTPTPTPTPTPASPTPTPTPTSAPAGGGPTKTATPQPTTQAKTPTPKPTSKPAVEVKLPEAGVTIPSVLGILGGAILLFIGLALAL